MPPSFTRSAGVGWAHGIAARSLEDFERVMAANVRSVFLGCRLTLPHLLQHARGSVVDTSSTGGLNARPGDPVCNAPRTQ